MQTKIQNGWQILALSLGAMTLGACTPTPAERVPGPTPLPTSTTTPTPVSAGTPNPAISAQERAVQLYPDLAVKGSPFNRAFLERLEKTRTTNPGVLTWVDWPVFLARQTGDSLGVQPLPERPIVTPAPVTPKMGSSLDKGAYDLRRSVPKTPAATPMNSR